LLVQPAVLLVCRDTGRDQVWPADYLEPWWQLAVVLAGIIAANATDELECVGVTAFWPACHDAGRRRSTNVQPSAR
jgi:hypothetical protein